MKRFNKIFIASFIVIAFALSASAVERGEEVVLLDWLKSSIETSGCREEFSGSNRAGVIENAEDLLALCLCKKSRDESDVEDYVGRLLRMNNIDFDSQLVVWVQQDGNKRLKPEEISFSYGTLKVVVENVARDRIQTQEFLNNPLYLYLTNRDRVILRSSNNGRLLRKIEVHQHYPEVAETEQLLNWSNSRAIQQVDPPRPVVVVTPKPVPENLRARAGSYSSVKLTWEDTDGEIGYILQRKKPGHRNWDNVKEIESNTTDYTDTGLDIFTVYAYRIKANYRHGDSQWSDLVEVKTNQLVPHSVQGFSARNEGHTVIILSWNDTSREDKYVIIRRQGNYEEGWETLNDNISPNTTTFRDSEVLPNTEYFYRIIAINSDGATEWEDASAKTDPDPESVINVQQTTIIPDRPPVRRSADYEYEPGIHVEQIWNKSWYNNKNANEKEGVIRSREGFVRWYENMDLGDSEDANKLLDEKGVDFTKQILIWVLGDDPGYYYNFRLEATSNGNGTLQMVIKEDASASVWNWLGKLLNDRTPLYLFATRPQAIKLERSGNEIPLSCVQLYQDGVDEHLNSFEFEDYAD